jgi:hypothetical protein
MTNLIEARGSQLTAMPKITLKRVVIPDLYDPLPGNIALGSRWNEPHPTGSTVTACAGSTSACCC